MTSFDFLCRRLFQTADYSGERIKVCQPAQDSTPCIRDNVMLNKYIFMAVIIAPNDTNANPNICSREVAQSNRRLKPHLSLH